MTTAEVSSTRIEFWERSLRGWDVAFYAMTALAAVAAFADPHGTSRAVAAGASFAVLVTAYTLLGRRGARTGDRRLVGAYLAVLLVVTVVVVSLSAQGQVLLFVAYSQIWYLAENRTTGVVLATLLTVGVAVPVLLGTDGGAVELLTTVAQLALALAFSIVLGLWLTQVAERGEERAVLLERLEAAQAELAVTHHSAGVLAERARVAQEIHDTLAQGFTSVIMLAQTASAELDAEHPARARERVTQIEQVARENLAEARALVAAFGPTALQDGDLPEALGRLARRFEAETGVRVEVRGLGDHDSPGEAPERAELGKDTEVVLLRAAQEALANVRKHAHARHVVLHLSLDADGATPAGSSSGPGATSGGHVQLEVVDDGRGLPADAVEGVGLRGMRERVRAGGGSLEVGSADGGGARVLLRLPVGSSPASVPAGDQATAPLPPAPPTGGTP
ncbi:sensor histidine kinase [Cellulomonas soli]|uniref:sensor histidine kinase n=1 Tax=Cellulomonas soli TaxID=931535 RepID=UPI003F8369A9